jgi:hypothetical protein
MNPKYKLDKDEINLLDETWEFIEMFNQNFLYLSDIRSNIIKQIRASYSPDEFMKFESIANKLFWNLRWVMHKVWTGYESDKLPYHLTLCKTKAYRNDDELDAKLMKIKMKYAGHYYRSFINKIIIVDKDKRLIYYKPMEGSANIFQKNYFNLMVGSIMKDRKLYEMVMKDPSIVLRINIPISQYYHQFDYLFPNLNFCEYKIGSDDDRMKRIKRMYYNEDGKIDKYWFKLIK